MLACLRGGEGGGGASNNYEWCISQLGLRKYCFTIGFMQIVFSQAFARAKCIYDIHKLCKYAFAKTIRFRKFSQIRFRRLSQAFTNFRKYDGFALFHNISSLQGFAIFSFAKPLSFASFRKVSKIDFRKVSRVRKSWFCPRFSMGNDLLMLLHCTVL